MRGNAVTLVSGRRWLASTVGFLVAPPAPLADRHFAPGKGSSGPDDGGAKCHDAGHDQGAISREATLPGQLARSAVFAAVILACLVFASGASAQALTVDLTRPANGATVQAGSVALEATATGAAYVEFWADGVKLAQDATAPYTATWNATAGSHRVAAVANDGQGRDSVWDGHRVADTHSVTAQTSQPTPPTLGLLPFTRHTLDPGERDSWVVHDSSGTEIYPPGQANGDKHGTIRWEPGGKYASTRKTYLILGFRPVSGSPGRMFDFHTHPSDAPYGWTPPQYPGGPAGPGVAPVAIDWFKGSGRGLEVVTEPNDWPSGDGRYHFRILSDSEMASRMNTMVWLWMEITWGRADGYNSPGPGRVRVWLAGENVPRVDTGNINTHWPDEGMVTFWTGTYWNQGAPERQITEIVGPRAGLTPRAAYEDNVSAYRQDVFWGDGLHGSLSPTSGAVPVPPALAW
jgi:Bacterial Ig domain